MLHPAIIISAAANAPQAIFVFTVRLLKEGNEKTFRLRLLLALIHFIILAQLAADDFKLTAVSFAYEGVEILMPPDIPQPFLLRTVRW